jgi:hypothetical protein
LAMQPVEAITGAVSPMDQVARAAPPRCGQWLSRGQAYSCLG